MDDTIEHRGHGTLSDTEDVELAAVEYVVRPEATLDDSLSQWGGELTLSDANMTVDPGRYVLTLDDGARVDVELEPLGAGDGDARTVEFRGVGVFGRRVEDS